MKRCAACGRFFDGEDCPTDHSFVEVYTPPPVEIESLLGHWTTYQLDGEAYPALYVDETRVVVFGPGENGHVGVYTVGEPDGS